MQAFHSLAEVRLAHLPPRIKKVLQDCLSALIQAYGEDFEPEDNYVVLYTRDTTDEHALALFGRTWVEACLEGVIYDDNAKCFLTCVLFSNEGGISIIVPDAVWLSPVFRAKLVNELVEPL